MFRLLCVSLGVSIALAVGEIAVRVLDVGPAVNVVYRENFRRSANPVLEYELAPGSRDGASVISSAGMRDREFGVGKPDGVFRIVVIGDSVTFGFECPREQTYPKQLETLLNQAATPDAPQFEVLNMGVTGYNMPQIVEALRSRGLRYEPDLVIYGYVLNDPQAFSLEAESLEALAEQTKRGLARGLSHGINRALRHSKLFVLGRQLFMEPPRRLDEQLEDPAYAALKLGSHYDYLRALHEQEESWRRVGDGLAELGRITATPRRIPLLVAVFPIEWFDDFEEYPLGDVHAQVIVEAEVNGLEAVDLADTFRAAGDVSEEKIFRDFLHPSPVGYRAVALTLLKWIADSDLPVAEVISLERLSDGGALDAAILGTANTP